MNEASLSRLVYILAAGATVGPLLVQVPESPERAAPREEAPTNRFAVGAQDVAPSISRASCIAVLENLKSVGIAINVSPKRGWQQESVDHLVEVLTSTVSKELMHCGVKVITGSNRFRAAFQSEALLEFDVRLPDSQTGAASLSVSLLELTTIKRNGKTVLSKTWMHNFSAEPLFSASREVSTFSDLIRATREASAGFSSDYTAANGSTRPKSAANRAHARPRKSSEWSRNN